MRTPKKAKKRLLDARREADAILATGANRLLLIEAILIVCVFVALFISLYSATALLMSALHENEILSSLLPYALSFSCLLLGVFLVLPVVLGLFRLAEQMQAGKTPVLMDLFYFLSTRERYLQGLRITRLASIKIMLMVLIVDTLNILWSTQIPDTSAFRLLGGAVTAFVIFLFVVWMLFPYSELYSLLRQTSEERPLRLGGGLRLVWFFLPWLLLGLVSIGLLLVLDVFPRMLLTYFCDCDRAENSH